MWSTVPDVVVTDLGDSADPAPTAALRTALEADRDVAAVSPTVFLGVATPGQPVAVCLWLTTVYVYTTGAL